MFENCDRCNGKDLCESCIAKVNEIHKLVILRRRQYFFDEEDKRIDLFTTMFTMKQRIDFLENEYGNLFREMNNLYHTHPKSIPETTTTYVPIMERVMSEKEELLKDYDFLKANADRSIDLEELETLSEDKTTWLDNDLKERLGVEMKAEKDLGNFFKEE